MLAELSCPQWDRQYGSQGNQVALADHMWRDIHGDDLRQAITVMEGMGRDKTKLLGINVILNAVIGHIQVFRQGEKNMGVNMGVAI